MADSNRVRLAYIEEVSGSFGTTPAVAQDATPQSTFRTMRPKGESLTFNLQNVLSDEIQPDGNIRDLIQAGASNAGDIQFELSFPQTRTFLGDQLGALLWSDWINLPELWNATADTTIGDAGTTANTYTVSAGGAAFVANHVVGAYGFTNSANNQVFVVTSSTATTVVGTALALTAEAIPPAGARLKVLGVQGAAGDLVATASGISSTAMNFITMGFISGMWIKIGGTAGGAFAFSTVPANNDWVRISAVTAHLLTLDHLPTGWGADTGATKTIRITMPDVLRNGTTRRSFTIEKGFLDVVGGAFQVFRGQTPSQGNLTLQSGQTISGTITYMGQTHATATAQIGAPAAATLFTPFSAVASVAKVFENFSGLPTGIFCKQLTLNINRNGREQTGLGVLGLVGVGGGRTEATAQMQTYFASKAIYDRFIAAAVTDVSFRLFDGTEGLIFTMPRAKYQSGKVLASGPNQDVMADMTLQGIYDSVTGCTAQFDRFEALI